MASTTLITSSKIYELPVARPGIWLAGACWLAYVLGSRTHHLRAVFVCLIMAFIIAQRHVRMRLRYLPYVFLIIVCCNSYRMYAARQPPRGDRGTFYLGAVPGSPGMGDNCEVPARFQGRKISLILPKELASCRYLEGQVIFLPPEGSRNPGGFDRKTWLYSQGICHRARLLACTRQVGHRPRLERWRRQCQQGVFDSLSTLFPDTRVPGLALGLLFGDKSQLSKNMKLAFSWLGTGHILAVSGMHLTFLLLPLETLRQRHRCSRKTFFFLSVGLIGCYLWLADFPPGLFRAALLFVIRQGKVGGRYRSDTMNNLGLAVTISCLINPFAFAGQGFLWSYGAAAALFLWSQDIKVFLLRRFPRLGERFLSQCSAALACQLAIVAFNLGSGYQLNPVYVLAQLPVCWLCQVIFLLIPVPLGLAFVFRIKAPISSFFLVYLTRLLETFVNLLASSKWPRLFTLKLNVFIVMAGVCLILCRLLLRRRRFWTYGFLIKKVGSKVFVCLMLTGLIYPYLFPKSVAFYMLDVGQGDAFVLRCQGQYYLFDGGTEDQADRVIIPFMQDQGISHFAACFLSHEDQDHSAAAARLMRWGKIDRLYLPEIFSERDSLLAQGKPAAHLPLTFVEQSARKHAVPIKHLQVGDIIRLAGDQVNLEVCQATRPDFQEPFSGNANSLWLLLNWQAKKILLTGDAPTAKEAVYISQDASPADVLKISHHGSKTASSERFLRFLGCRHVLLSVGRHNRYGHPHPLVLERLQKLQIQVWRTDQDGAIRITQPTGHGFTFAGWFSKRLVKEVE